MPSLVFVYKSLADLSTIMAMHGPVALWSWLIIGLTCLVSWLGFRSRAVEEKYIFDPRAVLAWKEYYRLVTSAFLHANAWHLLWNMVSLYFFGPLLETVYGPQQFLLIYFGSVVGGDLLSLYVHRHHEYRSIGASGGVCGLIFAYILLFPGASIAQFPLPIAIPGWLYAILFMVGSFLAMKDNNRGNVGHDAHLGGAIVGLFVAAALQPRIARENWKIFLIVAVASTLLLIYLWINPLFLPVRSFFGSGSMRKSRSPGVPSYQREVLKIDTLLDKVSKLGMDSLSPEERKFLQEVSGKYQRRGQSNKPDSGLAI